MNKKILSIVLLLAVLVVIIIALAPARAIFPFITDKVAGLSLSQPEGTVWSSSIKRADYYKTSIENIELELNPLPLFAANLVGTLRVSDNNVQLDSDIKFSQQEQQLTNLKYRVDAEWLRDTAKLPLQSLSGFIDGVVIDGHYNSQTNEIVSLNGSGSWSEAAFSFVNYSLALGDIDFQLNNLDEKTIELTIVDNQGPLDLKGTISLSTAKQYTIDINMSEQLPADLAPTVKRIGEINNGRVYIKWRGQLR